MGLLVRAPASITGPSDAGRPTYIYQASPICAAAAHAPDLATAAGLPKEPILFSMPIWPVEATHHVELMAWEWRWGGPQRPPELSACVKK